MTDPWDELYPTSTIGAVDSYSPWYTISSSGGEIDLRQEMHRTLYGASDETAKGRTGLLRRMRRDANNKFVFCPCRDIITNEPDKDYICRTCWGMGYLWDEETLVYFRDDDTLRRSGEVYFYVEYTVNPNDEDYIIQLSRDVDGVPSIPAEREDKVYNIIEAEAFRSDSGRIEYWRCRTKIERKWSVWYGVTSRQHQPSR
jgi:hypothetical protein